MQVESGISAFALVNEARIKEHNALIARSQLRICRSRELQRASLALCARTRVLRNAMFGDALTGT